MRIPGVSGATPAEALRAVARYPDVAEHGGLGLFLALSFLDSDRRAAGLGALDREKRRGREVYRTKEIDLLNGRVIWTLGVDKPARQEIPRVSINDLVPWDMASLTSKVTVVTIPAARFEVCVAWDARELQEQRGRDTCARLLRQARRELAARR